VAVGSEGREEEPLRGGTANRGLVVRVGDTVRRPQTPFSEAVHALLSHLEDEGFDGAPRHLGRDSAGREVLSYVEGAVPIQPTPPWAYSDTALVSVADLLRRYHEAVSDFDPTPFRWRTHVPDGYRTGPVSHNDPNLDNVVFRDGRAVALIDFDLASPGSIEWDLATAARCWVPLQDPRDSPPEVADRAVERLRLFADAYGLTPEQRRRVVLAVPETRTWGYDIVRAGAESGHLGYTDHWTRAQDRYQRGTTWLERNLDALVEAVS
jgi:aminoglycoside phosphotransferase (APT) family kinase protein